MTRAVLLALLLTGCAVYEPPSVMAPHSERSQPFR